MDDKTELSSQFVVKIESEGICRLCARRKDDCTDVLNENDQSLLIKIKDVLKVKVSPFNPFSCTILAKYDPFQILPMDEWQKICLGCHEKLEICYEFYEEVQRAQQHFIAKRTIQESPATVIKEEVEVEIQPEIKLEHPTEEENLSEPPEFESRIVNEEIQESSESDEPDEPELDDSDEEEENENSRSGKDLEKVQSNQINKFYNFRCFDCHSDLRTFTMYQMHMRKVHQDDTPTVACCDMSIPCQRGKLLEHYLIHTSPEELQCQVCSKQYLNKRAKRRHEKSHGQKRKTTPRLPCPNCDRMLADRASLQSHIKNMHTPDNLRQKYQCDLCEKKLTTKFSVLNHLIVKHKMEVANPLTNNEEILCPFCAKCFKNRSTYNYHYQVKHNITMTVCPECGIEMNKKSLRSHMRRTHDYQTQNCPICHKQFRNMHAVLLHKNRVHVDAKHKCDLCGKMFKMKDKLKEHRKGHIIENRFQCDLCSVANNDYANILKHRKQVHPNATPIPHGMGKKILEMGYQQAVSI